MTGAQSVLSFLQETSSRLLLVLHWRCTPEPMRDQQNFAVFATADLLDDVEALLDLQTSETLRCQLHQLVDQAAVGQAQLNHLQPQQDKTKQVFTLIQYGHTQLLHYITAGVKYHR